MYGRTQNIGRPIASPYIAGYLQDLLRLAQTQPNSGVTVTTTPTGTNVSTTSVAPSRWVPGPGHSLNLSPCMTRELYLARGLTPETFRNYKFDRYGCQIDSYYGARVADNTGPWLAPAPGSQMYDFLTGAPLSAGQAQSRHDAVYTDTGDAWFYGAVFEFVKIAARIVGPSLADVASNVISQALSSAGIGVSTIVGDVTTFLDTIKGVVQTELDKLGSQVQDVAADAMRTTFERFGFTFKSVMDALPSLQTVIPGLPPMDPSQLTSFLGVREALDITRHLGISSSSAVSIVKGLAGSGLKIDSLASALQYRDMQKSFVGMQNANALLKNEVGSIDPDHIARFFSNPANIKPIEQLSAVSFTDPDFTSSAGMRFAHEIASTYGGKTLSTWSPATTAIIAQFDPSSIAEAIPSFTDRADFIASAVESVRFGRAIESSVRSASQMLTDDLNGIAGEANAVASTPSFLYSMDQNVWDSQRQLRERIYQAHLRADDTVRAAVRAAGGAVRLSVASTKRTRTTPADPFAIMRAYKPNVDTRGVGVERGVV